MQSKPAANAAVARIFRLIVSIVIVIAILACVLPTAYYVIVPQLDTQLCVPRVAQRLGVQATHESIEAYTNSLLKPGMTPTEVRAALEKVAPVDIAEGKAAVNGILSDEITVRMCTHPSNNLVILAQYSDGKLISANIKEN